MARPEKYRDGYRIRWTDHTGKRQCEVHGVFREAEQALRKHQAEADAVKAGTRLPPPQKRKFEDLCDYWERERMIHKRSAKDDECILRRHLRPAFRGMVLSAIGVAEIDALRRSKTHLNPKTVSNILTLLATMLKTAVELTWLLQAPVVKKPKVKLNRKNFRFLQDEDEIGRLLTAAQADGPDAYALYATAIYSGLRAGELAGLRWSDISFKRREIIVERSYEGDTKSGEVRYVPIFDPLLPLLKAWRDLNPAALVFPNRDGKMLQPSAQIFQERLHRVLDAAGFERPDFGRYVHAVNFHSLRHTFGSHFVMNGGQIYTLKTLMGHQSIEMTERYAHLAPRIFHAELGRFGSSSLPAPTARPDKPRAQKKSAS
jgi:integrase